MKIGSLFSGYGGLDMGVQSVLGGTTAWFCEFDKAPSRILAHHWPDVPNLGDITAVDWSTVEPVDVLTGGFPCQDVSHAGRRAGLIRDGEGRTRSGLWGHMLRAIDELRPSLVVAENVRGLLSARADSDVEPCPWCLGNGDGEPAVRALGAVLADLADVGYDAWWVGLRAADVGAAHGRFRVFIFAVPADADADLRERGGWCGLGAVGGSAAGIGQEGLQRQRSGHATGGGSTPTAEGLTLLPTPAVNDMGASYTPEEWDAWTATMQAKHGNGNGHGKSLAIEAQRLTVPGDESVRDAEGGVDLVRDGVAGGVLPLVDLDEGGEVADGFGAEVDVHDSTLAAKSAADLTSSGSQFGNGATDGTKGGPNQRGSSGDLMLPSAVNLLPTPSVADVEGGRKHRSGERSDELLLNGIAHHDRWGDYAPAIARWEAVIGRPAPAPTEPGKNGNPRLSPVFVEWLMGLPAGHVTDPAIGLTRNEQLKALGNGVVWQQCAAATRWWLDQIRSERGAA